MIETITYDDGLPISVIIPTAKSRQRFFYDFVFPLIEANRPIEIIINDDTGSAAKKRNAGFKSATQPFVYFLDDDCLLPVNHLQKLYDTLLINPNKGYAYTGYKGIVMHPNSHPMHGNFNIKTQDFNGKTLLNGNYISTMALLRKELFIGFDETIPMLEDWDFWLKLFIRKVEGIAVYENEFYAFYNDDGTTSTNNNKLLYESDAIIKKRYNPIIKLI